MESIVFICFSESVELVYLNIASVTEAHAAQGLTSLNLRCPDFEPLPKSSNY